MSDTDPMEPFRILSERMKEAASEIGLEQVNFAVTPGSHGEPNMAQIVFIITPGAMLNAEERIQADADRLALQEMDRQMRTAEHEETVLDIKTTGRDFLRELMEPKPKGNDGDDDGLAGV